MRRIRIVFLLLGVLILVPLLLLVQRALEGVAREREVSHRAVAERLFDEMERELSSLLRAEEERPFEDYRAAGKANADGSGRRSDTAVVPANEAYVVGYFEIDPDGNFVSPRSFGSTDSDRAAGAAPAASPPQAKLEAVRELEELVEQALVKPALEGRAKSKSGFDDAFADVAESSVVVGGMLRDNATGDDLSGADALGADAQGDKAQGDKAQGDNETDAPAKAPSREANTQALAAATAAPEQKEQVRKQVSTYDALQSLNKGALARSERQVKRPAPEPEPRWRGLADDKRLRALPYGGESAAEELPAVIDHAGAPADVMEELPAEVLQQKPAEVAKKDAASEVAAHEIFDRIATEDAGVEVYPMSGRLIDAARLLLDREVIIRGERYRQGLVVDVQALFLRLDQTVLGGSELAPFVARSFYTAEPSPTAAADGGEFRFRHRFAEPFDALGVQLELTPLPDVGGSAYLTAIAVLLLLSGTGGLFALYRMVTVTVRFAERRNNFVAAVSHELKTPLTAIRMYGEMLRDGMVEDPEKRQEYYATITAESERLTRLIDNVLEFSRLEQGTREANLVAGSVGPAVREAAAILEPHARELGFRVEVDVDEDLPPVQFERDAVMQVVFNLVDNALKYARDAGDRVIAIRCSREDDGVCVAVSDRGPGVPAPHLSKIFEPFYRCEDELTRTAKGTGIGLALVRGLADSMGAAVSSRNLGEGGFEVSLRFRPLGS